MGYRSDGRCLPFGRGWCKPTWTALARGLGEKTQVVCSALQGSGHGCAVSGSHARRIALGALVALAGCGDGGSSAAADTDGGDDGMTAEDPADDPGPQSEGTPPAAGLKKIRSWDYRNVMERDGAALRGAGHADPVAPGRCGAGELLLGERRGRLLPPDRHRGLRAARTRGCGRSVRQLADAAGGGRLSAPRRATRACASSSPPSAFEYGDARSPTTSSGSACSTANATPHSRSASTSAASVARAPNVVTATASCCAPTRRTVENAESNATRCASTFRVSPTAGCSPTVPETVRVSTKTLSTAASAATSATRTRCACSVRAATPSPSRFHARSVRAGTSARASTQDSSAARARSPTDRRASTRRSVGTSY